MTVAQLLRVVQACRHTLEPMEMWLRECPGSAHPPRPWTAELAMKALREDGRMLARLPRRFRRPRTFQREALLQIALVGSRCARLVAVEPFLITLFSGRLEVPFASAQRGTSLCELLCGEPRRLAALLQADGRNLGALPEHLRDRPDLAAAAACPGSFFCGLRWASRRLLNDEAFMLQRVTRDPRAYRLCSEALRARSLPVLRAALRGQCPGAMLFARPPLCLTRAARVAAVLEGGGVRALPPHLRANQAGLLEIADEAGQAIARSLCEPLAADALFQLELVRRCPDAMPHLPLRHNDTFVRAVLALQPWTATRLQGVAQRDAIRRLMPPWCDRAALARYFQAPLRGGADGEEDDLERPRKRLKLEEELKCPICRGLVQGVVLQCRHGHIFCSSCVAQLHGTDFVCPVCRLQQPREGLARSLLAEALSESLGKADA